jgi:hypothetical protein
VRTNIPEKVVSILRDIDQFGSQEPTRLTVLKKWFQVPSRAKSFGIFVANRASGRSGKVKSDEKELFRLSRKLLNGADVVKPSVDKRKARELHRKLHDFQKEQKRTRWAVVRIIKNWNLFLIEEALQIYLNSTNDVGVAYKLASDYCRHYDPRYGDTLNLGSRHKLKEIIRFMFTVEASEDIEPRRKNCRPMANLRNDY